MADVLILAVSFLRQTSARFNTDLRLVSKEVKKGVDEDTFWKDLLHRKYPTSRNIIAKDFRKAYIEATKFLKTSTDFELNYYIAKNDAKLLLCGPGIPGVDEEIRDFVNKRSIGESQEKQCVIDFCTMTICVMHKTGQEDLPQFRETYFIRYTELIMLFNPKNHTDFDEYVKWIGDYERMHDAFLFYRPAMLLVECRSSRSEMNKNVESQVEKLAKEMGADYMEIVYHDEQHIENMFIRMRDLIVEKEKVLDSVQIFWQDVAKAKINSSKKKCDLM